MTDMITKDEQFPSVFDSLTDSERIQFHSKMAHAVNAFYQVSLTLGSVCQSTLQFGTPSEVEVWAVRARFRDAAHDTIEIMRMVTP